MYASIRVHQPHQSVYTSISIGRGSFFAFSIASSMVSHAILPRSAPCPMENPTSSSATTNDDTLRILFCIVLLFLLHKSFTHAQSNFYADFLISLFSYRNTTSTSSTTSLLPTAPEYESPFTLEVITILNFNSSPGFGSL